MYLRRTALLLAAPAAAAAAAVVDNDKSHTGLPVVDLGYEIHRAISFNTSSQYYNFSNIRYAAPPLGNLRFAAPAHPARNRSVVRDGSDSAFMCPQSPALWQPISIGTIPSYLENGTPTVNAQAAAYKAAIDAANRDPKKGMQMFNISTMPVPPNQSEDCLFLDVQVPKSVFPGRKRTSSKSRGAPVVVWLYGGGFAAGDKVTVNTGPPEGLFISGKDNPAGTGEPFIYVALNYRLGALGFMAGPQFRSEGGISNAGLLDQRFALEWVQKYISRFGGDPKRVTVLGQSAGGASIIHQLTAYAGRRGPAPFQRAITQSAAWFPTVSKKLLDDNYKTFLEYLGVKTLAEARKLASVDVIRIQYFQILISQLYGSYTFGPAADGHFVPHDPSRLLAAGKFDHSVTVMSGHNSDEGLFFASPFYKTNEDYDNFLKSAIPTLTPAQFEHVTCHLYPPVYDGRHGYKSVYERAKLTFGDVGLNCPSNYLARAYNNRTHNYLFSMPPGIHSQDQAYVYYDYGDLHASALSGPQIVNATAAIVMQNWITSFVQGKTPATGVKGVPHFPRYGKHANILNVEPRGIVQEHDPASNERCSYWQKVL